MSIRNQYEGELEKLKRNVVKLAADTEQIIRDVIPALTRGDAEKAQSIIKSDKEIACFEALIEKQCFHILLSQQPVARDFREVSAALKIITDLERVAHQCSDVAELVESWGEKARDGNLSRIPAMGETAAGMVKDAVSAYAHSDVDAAREVYERDDVLDALFVSATKELICLIKEDDAYVEQGIMLMMAAKYFERMGDHAAHISDWVAYYRTGRHLRDKYGEKPQG